MSRKLTTDTDLTAIANAIRTKGGTSAPLVYPTGFVSAIEAIETGGGMVGHTVKVRNEHSEYPFTCCVIYADGSFERLWYLNQETTINNVAYIIGGWDNQYNGDYISTVSDCTVAYTSYYYKMVIVPNNDNAIVTYSCSCLSGNTLILMANKEYKRIDEINAGEKVLSFNPETKQFEEDEVTYSDATENKIHTEYDIWYFENDYEVTTIHRHRFYNVEHERMMYMDEWQLGEHTITNSGIQIALIGHKHIQEPIKHYTIFTNRQNYFANGMLSGNRYTQPISLNDLSDKEKYTDIDVPIELNIPDSKALNILLGRDET